MEMKLITIQNLTVRSLRKPNDEEVATVMIVGKGINVKVRSKSRCRRGNGEF